MAQQHSVGWAAVSAEILSRGAAKSRYQIGNYSEEIYVPDKSLQVWFTELYLSFTWGL
jgi:hypothetical protein